MQAIAKLRYLRISPRKVRLVASLIRGLKADEAVVQLENMAKEAKRPVLKLLQSAIANATNNLKINKETLKVETIMVDNGPILYRSMPRAQGRATPIRKRTSHITIILAGEVDSKEEKKLEKEAEKVEKKEKKVKAKKEVKLKKAKN